MKGPVKCKDCPKRKKFNSYYMCTVADVMLFDEMFHPNDKENFDCAMLVGRLIHDKNTLEQEVNEMNMKILNLKQFKDENKI